MQGAKGNGHHSADKADDVEHHAEVWGGQLYQEGLGVQVEKGASTSARMNEGDEAKETHTSVTDAVSNKVSHFLQFIVHRINNMHIQRACKLSIKASIHNILNYLRMYIIRISWYILSHTMLQIYTKKTSNVVYLPVPPSTPRMTFSGTVQLSQDSSTVVSTAELQRKK